MKLSTRDILPSNFTSSLGHLMGSLKWGKVTVIVVVGQDWWLGQDLDTRRHQYHPGVNVSSKDLMQYFLCSGSESASLRPGVPVLLLFLHKISTGYGTPPIPPRGHCFFKGPCARFLSITKKIRPWTAYGHRRMTSLLVSESVNPLCISRHRIFHAIDGEKSCRGRRTLLSVIDGVQAEWHVFNTSTYMFYLCVWGYFCGTQDILQLWL